MATSSSSYSLLMNPLTSTFLKTTQTKLGIFFHSSSLSQTRLNHCPVGPASSLRFTKRNYASSASSSSSVRCKAVSVNPQTEVEGLNIAEDVTQDKAATNAVAGYSVLLPQFLSLLDFYDSRKDIDFAVDAYKGTNLSDPFRISMVDQLPTQKDIDCGVFTIAFAKYFAAGIDMSTANFDIESLPSRYAVSLYNYAKYKQNHDHVSDSEDPGNPKTRKCLKKN